MKAFPDDVSNFLQNYFDKILVISTPRFTDRQQRLQQNFDGLPFEFSWGADKLQLNMETVQQDGTYDAVMAAKLERLGNPLHLGEVACSISHRNIYEAMIKNGWKKVFIMEDDALPLYNNLHLLPVALKELPADWELVYLGYLKHEKVTASLKTKQFFYKILSRFGLMKWSYTMVSNLLPRPFSAHLRKAGFHDCAHAYAITLSAAEKMLAAQTPIVYRADDLLAYTIMKGELNAFVTEPKFFDQVDFHTTGNSKIKS